MSDDEGLLSQDDIDAALSEAGVEPSPPPGPRAPARPAGGTDARGGPAGEPFEEIAAAMVEEIEERAGASRSAGKSAAVAEGAGVSIGGAVPFAVPELADRSSGATLVDGIDLLRDVELNVKIELGHSRMLVDDVLRLAEGSVVELDKLAGDPVDVFVNERLVARGEVLVLNDNFCVRISDVVKQEGEEEN